MSAASVPLPRLPVPDLAATVHRYLKSVAPLAQSDEQFKDTAFRALRFLRTDEPGMNGATLHRLLLERARSHADRSWLIDWWNCLMYTAWRLPVPINVSYWYLLSEAPFAAVDAIAAELDHTMKHARAMYRAAAMLLETATYRDARFAGLAVIPEEGVSKGLIDPSMHRYVLHACRLPRPGDDGVRVYDGTGRLAPLDAVVVIRKDRLYVVSLLMPATVTYSSSGTSSSVARVSLHELAKRLASAVQHADVAAATALPVGVLTAAHRETWASAFAQLAGPGASQRPSHGVTAPKGTAAEAQEERCSARTPGQGMGTPEQAHNLRIITSIESAMAVVCFDEGTPSSVDVASRNLLAGAFVERASDSGSGRAPAACRNRWFDKAAQFVVCDGDGRAGYVGEHSHCDGAPTAAMMAWMCDRLTKGQGTLSQANQPQTLSGSALTLADSQSSIPWDDRIVPIPASAPVVPLEWAVCGSHSNALRAYVDQAQAEATSAAADHDCLALVWTAYGREGIKTAGLSPDAWAEMALQESCAAVRAIDAALSAQDRGDHTAAVVTAYRLLKAAGARHTDNARLASAGLDVDRHLLGMKLLWNDEKAKLRQKPSIDVAASKALKMEESDSPAALFFSDPLYATASTWMISTSNLSYECFDNWGWRVLSTAMGQYLLYIQRVLSTLRRGEVVPGGLGVAFCTRAQSLRFNIVAERSTNASAFVAELKRALYDMMALARSAQSTHKSVNSSGDTTSVTSARL